MTTASISLPVVDATDRSTRERILRLVVEEGPVSVHDLARDLDLTAAGVRRHVAALEEDGLITVHTVAAHGQPRRGRPARRYVATDRGQASLSSAYADLATDALAFLARLAGDEAVEAFAAQQVADLEKHLLRAIDSSSDDVAARVESLAAGLAAQGYAASARPVPGGRAVQLCQGHCPVRDVAAQFPQLCEAETRLFSQLLGVHVQRLSTLAAGGHVCTTHVPIGTTPTLASNATVPPTFVRPATDSPAPAATVEGTR
ncbi:MAG TPA: winged helix-turn-helix transcriptional regulator [Actinotalea sp.]